MRIEANKVKWIKRAVLLMMAMMFLCLQPVQARAEEDEGEYYKEYGEAYIYFKGEYIFEN